MIPIECPKCGRGGSVPPDRLNARLVCKACHQVFHLDNTGRMVLGEPESFDMKTNKSRADEVSSLADFDFAQTWNDIPKPVKFGVPGVLLAVFGWLYLRPEPGAPDYIGQAESLVRAVATNDKSRAVSIAIEGTAADADKWFDIMHNEFEKSSIDPNVTINPQLFAGNAEKDAEITLMVVVAKDGGTSPPVTVTLPMKRDGSSWKFDGAKGMEGTAKMNTSKNKR